MLYIFHVKLLLVIKQTSICGDVIKFAYHTIIFIILMASEMAGLTRVL